MCTTTSRGIEEEMTAMLKAALGTDNVLVKDVSGGCGASYNVLVESEAFKGKNKVQQARMVYNVLETEISSMHAISVTTKIPSYSRK